MTRSTSPASIRTVSPHQADLNQSMRYRMYLPIMVLAFRDNHQAAITIVEGETLEVIGPDQDDRFLVVKSKGEEFLVFASDLKARGRPIRTQAASMSSGSSRPAA